MKLQQPLKFDGDVFCKEQAADTLAQTNNELHVVSSSIIKSISMLNVLYVYFVWTLFRWSWMANMMSVHKYYDRHTSENNVLL